MYRLDKYLTQCLARGELNTCLSATPRAKSGSGICPSLTNGLALSWRFLARRVRILLGWIAFSILFLMYRL